MSKVAKSKCTDPSKSIFVSGLHSDVTEEILWELFLQVGPLASVKIPINRESGRPRTFGFVMYQDSCSVPYACELFNSLKLFGRAISCKPQHPTDHSRPGGQGQSPNQLNASSDENLGNLRTFNEMTRTPSLQFFGVDESPYGRTPNMAPSRSYPSLQRSVSNGSILPLMMQNYHKRMSDEGLFNSPIRRDRQQYEIYDRRHRTKPY